MNGSDRKLARVVHPFSLLFAPAACTTPLHTQTDFSNGQLRSLLPYLPTTSDHDDFFIKQGEERKAGVEKNESAGASRFGCSQTPARLGRFDSTISPLCLAPPNLLFLLPATLSTNAAAVPLALSFPSPLRQHFLLSTLSRSWTTRPRRCKGRARLLQQPETQRTAAETSSGDLPSASETRER